MCVTADPSKRLNIKREAAQILLPQLPTIRSAVYDVTVVTADGQETPGVGLNVRCNADWGREVFLRRVR